MQGHFHDISKSKCWEDRDRSYRLQGLENLLVQPCNIAVSFPEYTRIRCYGDGKIVGITQLTRQLEIGIAETELAKSWSSGVQPSKGIIDQCIAYSIQGQYDCTHCIRSPECAWQCEELAPVGAVIFVEFATTKGSCVADRDEARIKAQIACCERGVELPGLLPPPVQSRREDRASPA